MMTSLILGAIALSAVSGLAGLLAGRRVAWGQWLSTLLLVGGNLGGLYAGLQMLFTGTTTELLRLPAPVPGAEFVLTADPLSLFFLLPILLVTLLGSVYGLEYWNAGEHPRDCGRLQFFYGLLAASLATLVLAKNSVTLLFSWELMSVSAFFVVGTQDEDDEVRLAAWLLLAASHAAGLSLLIMFSLLYAVTGSYELVPVAPELLTPGMATAIFLLGLVGFGLKAGIMPLHFWLPSTYANSPSHISAVMSGVVSKTGIYGLLRLTSVLPAPALWWGELLFVLGAVSAVLGIMFAVGQRDLKRLLAYSSIENVGIISIGLGLALVGRTIHEATWVTLGLSGCLLHVWNHSLFKSLLFFGAGSVIQRSQTCEIDRMGGFARPMPWTAACFLLGAIAICGLPPLNGFISELIIYLGIFHTLGIGEAPLFPLAAILAPVLALTGALALAAFVKAFGVVFLGAPRTPPPHPPREVGWVMRGPMLLLCGCCLTIGIGSPLIAPLIDQARLVWTGPTADPTPALAELAPLSSISTAVAGLLIAIMFGWAWLEWRIRSRPLDWTETWGCGYSAPTARMQYTGSSLTQMLVELFSWPLRPVVRRPQIDRLFPESAAFESRVPEVVLERAVLPVIQGWGRVLFWFRLMQQGNVQIYLLYIVAILAVLLMFWK